MLCTRESFESGVNKVPMKVQEHLAAESCMGTQRNLWAFLERTSMDGLIVILQLLLCLKDPTGLFSG